MPDSRIEALTLCDRYLPGFKAGGPITTIANMVERLHPSVRFKIATRDRDSGDGEAYPGKLIHQWQQVGPADVFYLRPGYGGCRTLLDVLRTDAADVLYLNSLFSRKYSFLPLCLRKRGAIPDRPVILAPRGELSPGALGIKPRRKLTFLRAVKAWKLHEGITWQASSQFEEADIRRWFGRRARVVIAPDLVIRRQSTPAATVTKQPGRLRAVFLSRIAAKKNLLGAIQMLAQVRGKVELTVVGPMEDSAYWQRCHAAIAQLPAGISVSYAGLVEPAKVQRAIAQHEVFFLPTLGENFGHVIIEALGAGCPVLISDQTPWRYLARQHAGWDLPLSQPEQFVETLQRLTDMDHEMYSQWRTGAARFAAAYFSDDLDLKQNQELFARAVSSDAGAHYRRAAA